MSNHLSRNLAATLMVAFCAMAPSAATAEKPMPAAAYDAAAKKNLEEKLAAGHAAANKLWLATLEEAKASESSPDLAKAMNIVVEEMRNDPEVSKAIGQRYSGNDPEYQGKTQWFADCWPEIKDMVDRGEPAARISQAISKSAMQPMQVFLNRKRAALQTALASIGYPQTTGKDPRKP